MKRKLPFAIAFMRLLAVTALLTFGSAAVWTQTTAFSYQGRLTDGGATANGLYDLQFKLFDAASAGNQIGATVTRDDVNVTNGVFSTTLDFGAAAFPGAARWLEISVRPGASTGAYTTLAPRQPVNSTPYAIRAHSAETVTGPIPASQITGTLPPSTLPPGGAYINNSTAPQADSNFNISGDGTAGGTLAGNAVNAATQYQLNGTKFLSGGSGNVFLGYQTGNFNTGLRNTMLGNGAGFANRAGEDNTYVGVFAGGGGSGNGRRNALFGSFAGYLNNSSDNTMFGYRAGYNTQSASNAFFGSEAGTANLSGAENAFFGAGAGRVNRSGEFNTFIGRDAGERNVNGSHNTFVGHDSGSANVSGSDNTFIGESAGATRTGISNSIAIGSGAKVDHSNTIVLGSNGVTDHVVVNGSLYFPIYTSGGSAPMCFTSVGETANHPGGFLVGGCSSSLRYKANIKPLPSGLSVINRLRSVSFDWKEGGAPDLGFIAEEVAEVEPRLTFRNDKGEIEGVKYQLVSAVLVNAVKEQQAQIEQQQKQLKQQQAELAQLKQLLCAAQPQAAVCQP
jgi:hypothetical protein